jgi:hypothetical protein
MIYTVKPKPTLYNGRKFRSRLEARWQYVFDKLGWTSEYEPSEINGRNPDFIIQCFSPAYPTNHIIVEVKPDLMQTPEYIEGVFNAYAEQRAHILILSETPFQRSLSNSNNVELGIGSQFFGQEDCERSDMLPILMKCQNDFGSDIMIYDGMMFGKVERKQFMHTQQDYREWVSLNHVWIESANKTMFLPV